MLEHPVSHYRETYSKIIRKPEKKFFLHENRYIKFILKLIKMIYGIF